MLYIFPTDLEAQRFRDISPDSRIVVSGVGMVATAAAIMHLVQRGDITPSEVVVLAGVAGAYGEDIAIASVVEVVEERCAELPQRFQQRYVVEPSTALPSVVSNTVHGNGAAAQGAEVENMEGAALFALARECGFRAVEIRAISNRVGESFEKWHLSEALDALTQTLQTLKL
ncbi:MAG: hypothetical protein IKY50_05310 [Alistipes sp.]|nr:hypothetical protein [Alistipes sp.]